MVAVGVFSPGRGGTAVSAQAPNPCALLTVDDVETIAANSTVADGVSSSLPAVGSVTCRYAWGVGTGRFKLDVTVNEASRMFPGVSADQMRQRLLDSVRAGTADAVLSDIGEAAVFTPQSPVYASATALVKGRILALHLDGIFAGEMLPAAREPMARAVQGHLT